MFASVASPHAGSFGGREQLHRNTAAERSWNPLNNIRADRFSVLNSPGAAPSRTTHTFSRGPSSTTFVWPWSRPSSSTVILGSSPTTVVSTSARWFGVALAIVGVSLSILGLAVMSPHLFLGGIGTAVVGGTIAALS